MAEAGARWREAAGLAWLEADWPAPAAVRTAVTQRTGGLSRPPFDALNLAAHVGDDPAAVAANRQRLREGLGLPAEPRWLSQVHGTAVWTGGEAADPVADAAVTRTRGCVLAVLTADCLPVFLSDRAGTAVGVAHAGWRGLAAGVLEATIAALGVAPAELLAWLGPAIGPQAFEVGPEVRAAFVAADPAAAAAFRPGRGDRHWADLAALARLRLAAAGVGWTGGVGACTVADGARWYSYRRDGRTGRFASLIWLA